MVDIRHKRSAPKAKSSPYTYDDRQVSLPLPIWTFSRYLFSALLTDTASAVMIWNN